MTKFFFTSDPHYSHKNVIEYCNRPFDSVEEMDEQLILNFNKKVGPDDVTFFLGDLFFCTEEKSLRILSRLNGTKRLILGNHDKRIRTSKPIQDCFEQIYPDLYQMYIDNIQVVMCHYPLLTWHKSHHGSFMLHGHCHNTIPFDGKHRRLDVGVDAQNFEPIAWTDIKKQLLKIDPKDPRNYTRDKDD